MMINKYEVTQLLSVHKGLFLVMSDMEIPKINRSASIHKHRALTNVFFLQNDTPTI